MLLFAIDPGNTESAFVIMDSETFQPYRFGKVPNHELIDIIGLCYGFHIEEFVIERVACYGMAVGREVFDTCEWIGRFTQIIESLHSKTPSYIFRTEEKKLICHSMTAGDSNIRRALIDRFAKHDLRTGKGTKKNPDFFYGFAKDVWAAFAVGVTHIEMKHR